MMASRRATKLVPCLRDLQYEERRKRLDPPALAYRRSWGAHLPQSKHQNDVRRHLNSEPRASHHEAAPPAESDTPPSFRTSNVENLSPQILRGVLKEMTELVKCPPEGIKVHMNEEDITDIQATITGPAGTPYAGGMFKVKLALGKDFPNGPPKGYFLTKIFHPNVASNGEICVNTLKKDWKADLGIRHVLLVIKCLLIVPNAESALNEEAGKLLLEAYDDYAARAKMITEIHAQGPKGKGEPSGEGSGQDGPVAKKHAVDKKIAADRKKLLKDKKRTLKRL